METNLLPIGQIIKSARQSGVTFGHGDPKIHLAYLTKLRLLPQAIRRKIGDQIVGCYPESVIPLLKKIEGLKDAGLTYSQIKYQLQNTETTVVSSGTMDRRIEVGNGKVENFPLPNSPFLASYPLSHYPLPLSSSYSPAFLIVGLLLGYLLAMTNVSRSNPQSPMTNDKSQVASVLSPLDDQSQTMGRIVTSKNSQGNEPIYLIAVPKQNLDRLGKININQLAPASSN